MMIGTCERVRISRHTSTPEMRGSITSSSTSCGLRGVEPLDRLGAVGGHLDTEAFALERDPQRVAVRLLVVDDEDERATRPSGDLLPSDACLRRSSSAIGMASRNVEPSPLDRLDGDVAAVRLRRRGARWRARARCRRSCGSAPGRPGRSARRSARGRRGGIPMPWSRHCDRERDRRSTAVSTSTVLPGSEYFTALSSRFVIALTTWRRSHATIASPSPVADLQADSARGCRRPDPIDRLVEQHLDRDRLPARGLLRSR